MAPHYERPLLPIPTQYKENGIWVSAKPSIDIATETQPWWSLFQDPTLNELEKKVSCDNITLKTALARYAEALAIAKVTRSALYPTINGVGTIARQKDSRNVVNTSVQRTLTYNTFLLAPILTYEVDAWGRVRNAVIANDTLAKASGFDLAAISLSMHAELAAAYFQLRGDEDAQRVLDTSVTAYEQSLYLTRQRFQWGADPIENVDQAITLLENAKTAATDMRLKRAQLEHAIAVLTGEIPANFKLPPRKRPFNFVSVAPVLPSTLLERRPDIAAAVMRVRAANASIGVARAAFFPAFNLLMLIGAQSSQLSELFSHKSLIWALGPGTFLTIVQPEINQVIFDGFKLQALLQKATANYYETVNAYKEIVLKAFQEVEDQLVAIRRLSEEMKTQTASTRAAKRALYQANCKYKGGITTFLNVVVIENEALQSELQLINIRTRRQLASVALMKALGGGWRSTSADRPR